MNALLNDTPKPVGVGVKLVTISPRMTTVVVAPVRPVAVAEMVNVPAVFSVTRN